MSPFASRWGSSPPLFSRHWRKALSASARELPVVEEPLPAGNNSHRLTWTRHFRRFWQPFLTSQEKSRIRASIEKEQQRTVARIVVNLISRSDGGDMLKLAEHRYAELTRKKF